MFNIKENCFDLKARLIQKYPDISEEDLRCSNGDAKKEMIERMQQKLGKTDKELQEIILKL
jgi:hypothetical protein